MTRIKFFVHWKSLEVTTNGLALNRDKSLKIYFFYVKRQSKNDFLKDVKSTVGAFRTDKDAKFLHADNWFEFSLGAYVRRYCFLALWLKHKSRLFITKTRLFKYTENFTTKKCKFSDKNSDIIHISAQNIDCGYSLEPSRGGSNEYP